MSRFSNLEINAKQKTLQAARTQPDRDDHHYIGEADQAFRGGRFEQAMRYYSRALEFNPNRQDAWGGQVRSLLELGELTEAGVWSAKALELFKDQSDLLSSRAVACIRQGDKDKAMAFSDAAIQQKLPSAWLWIARGEIMLAVQRTTDVFCFDKARELSQGDWLAPLQVARTYLYYRNAGRGMQWAREAQKLKPEAAFTAFVVGQCHQALGLIDDARQAYALATRLDPDFPLVQPVLRALAQESWTQQLRNLWRRLRHRP